MITKKDIACLKESLEKAFPNKTSEERKKMLDSLVNYPGADTAFITIVNGNITRIGVKAEGGHGCVHKLYYVTEYYSEWMDD